MPRKKEMAVDSYIGARLRLRRLMLGLSQEALGAKVSLTFQQVQKYEKGVNRISASRLFELSRALDVPVQYFYEGLDDPDDKAGFSEAVAPYLDFVSSGEGVQLNRAFLQIPDGEMRRRLLAMVEGIARVSGDETL